MNFKVKLLNDKAVMPTVAHPGSDLGFDVYAAEDVVLPYLDTQVVSTGIAVSMEGHGFIVRDRSSLAARGILISGGVIDEGYRGEIKIIMTLVKAGELFFPPNGTRLKAGDKIAQLIPVRPATNATIIQVEELSTTARGVSGFGSSGK